VNDKQGRWGGVVGGQEMRLDQWCNIAQNDQNSLEISHLCANYRHSRRTALITAQGVESFTAALESVFRAKFENSKQEGGTANLILEKAKDVFYDRPAPDNPAVCSDFRLDGNEISSDADTIFVSLARHSLDGLRSATRPASSRLGRSLGNEARIVWLTRPDDVIRKLRRGLPGKTDGFDERSFFAELTALLGLKPRGFLRTRYRLDLYCVRKGQTIFRPHGLSHGYPDRFCGKSAFPKFGTTIDNRDGKSGLPEAIVLASQVQWIEPGEKPHINLKERLSAFAPWIDAKSAHAIEADLSSAEVHAEDASYGRLRPTILRRLRETGNNCDRRGAPICVCGYNLPASGSRQRHD
jgi:hypothetical protein